MAQIDPRGVLRNLMSVYDDDEEAGEPMEESSQREKQEGQEEGKELLRDEERVPEGMCVECGDQPAQKSCRGCEEDFCEVCFFSIHRSGSRKDHEVTDIESQAGESNKRKGLHEEEEERERENDKRVEMQAEFKKEEELDELLSQGQEAQTKPEVGEDNAHQEKNKAREGEAAVETMSEDEKEEEGEKEKEKEEKEKEKEKDGEEEEEDGDDDDEEGEMRREKDPGEFFVERAKYIPLRLDANERRLLKLLEAALNVSEYTDKVDVLNFSSKSKRMFTQLTELCSILSGLVLATDYNTGLNLIKGKDFNEFEDFFQQVFEVGRRFKIMNPERMRTDYGKLIYLLQDSQLTEIQNALGFDTIMPIRTIYSLLASHDALDLLRDRLLSLATREIADDGKSRAELEKETRLKEKAMENLCKRYARGELTPELIRTCLYSISDSNSYLRTSRDTISKMIGYLKSYFRPEGAEDLSFSLAIRYGVNGARLTHSHATQYTYVLQSLTLWREITHEMYKFWQLGEADLLSDSYHLRDTGQGLNRVQRAPRVSREISSILYRTQKRVGDWVGSSAIHLGDHDVPNAFMFIDKYTQIPRILNPIASTISKIDELVRDPEMKVYVDATFGGKEELKKEILCDFFKHGFDGSGADNFFDAGSCIDGRSTSAWNWCSKIEKKRYFPIFLLTDFTGFDGKF